MPRITQIAIFSLSMDKAGHKQRRMSRGRFWKIDKCNYVFNVGTLLDTQKPFWYNMIKDSEVLCLLLSI
jgi:hypothetical protein